MIFPRMMLRGCRSVIIVLPFITIHLLNNRLYRGRTYLELWGHNYRLFGYRVVWGIRGGKREKDYKQEYSR